MGSSTKGALGSLTVWSGAAAAGGGLAGILSLIGIITPSEISELSSHVVALVGGVLAVWRRIVAKKTISGIF